MSYPFDQNNYGNNYFSFEGNNSSKQLQNQSQQQMRVNNNLMTNQLNDKPLNYQQSYYGNSSRPPLPRNQRSHRPPQKPYYGQNSGPIRNQYRAQVIDYTNQNYQNTNINHFNNNNNNYPLLRDQPSIQPTINQQIRPLGGMPFAPLPVGPPQQPLLGQPTGLLPTPNSYQNLANNPRMTPPLRPYPTQQPLIPQPVRGLLPVPNSSPLIPQQFPPLLPQQQPLNSMPNYNQKPSVPQTTTFATYGSQQIRPQNVVQQRQQQLQQQINNFRSLDNNEINSHSESALEAQKKLEASRIDRILSEGMENKVQNDLKGFYCLFCEVFCNNVVSAERHVETPKHHRTKIGDNLRGIDAKFTIKSERISETKVALARKEQLLKISNVVKNEYLSEGIRLKDGIGPNSYVCENCGVSIESLESVKQHLELHKLFTEQLKVCSKPIIGLDFIIEYIDPDPSKPRIYECSMCRSLNTTKEMITHVCSFLHRTNFIKKIHPSEGAKYTAETPQLSLEAGKRALELETLVGRGHFRVKHQSAPQDLPLAPSTAPLVSSEPTSATAVKPIIQIELPKPKAEHEKSELEKLFCVHLKSEEEANDVTALIKNITDSVMEYHLKGLTPHMREKFKKQLKQNEDIYQNIVK